MDARQRVAAVCHCCLFALCGCTLPNSGPAVQPNEGEYAPDEEHSQVVEADETRRAKQAADIEPDMGHVQRWIEQIERRDDVRSRIDQQPPSEALTPLIQDAYELTPGAPAGEPQASEEAGAADPQEAEPPLPETPVLGDVTVRAAATQRSPTLPAATVSPSVNAPEYATDHLLSLAEFAEQWLARPTDPSFRSQLDQRLVQVLAGKYEDARQSLDLVSSEQQLMATHFIEALIAIREGHGGEPGAETDRVLAQLKQLEDSLIPLSDLRIPRLALARAVRGFGRYEAFEPPEFLTGRENEFVVYCEVANFLSRLRDDGRYESQFSMRTAVLNRAGDRVLEIDDEHITDECRTRRRDCFIPRLVRLPATLSPGQYVVKVTIVDKIGKKVAENRTTFRIVARS